MTLLQKRIIKFFRDEDRGMSEDDILQELFDEDDSEVRDALEELCDDGYLSCIDTFVGKFYSLQYTEDDEDDSDMVSVNFDSADGLEALSRALGVDMSERAAIVSSLPKHASDFVKEALNIDDPVFLKGDFDAETANRWLASIEANKAYLVQLKQIAGKKVSEQLESYGFLSLASFGMMMKTELAAIAELREMYYSEIERVIKSGLRSRIKEQGIVRALNEYLDDLTDYMEEDMTINGANRIAVPVPKAEYYKKALKI